jgi:hypothetical protein
LCHGVPDGLLGLAGALRHSSIVRSPALTVEHSIGFAMTEHVPAGAKDGIT